MAGKDKIYNLTQEIWPSNPDGFVSTSLLCNIAAVNGQKSNNDSYFYSHERMRFKDFFSTIPKREY